MVSSAAAMVQRVARRGRGCCHQRTDLTALSRLLLYSRIDCESSLQATSIPNWRRLEKKIGRIGRGTASLENKFPSKPDPASFLL